MGKIACTTLIRDCGSFWTDEEVNALIAIWAEEEIHKQLDGSTRNIKVCMYEKIATRLSLLELEDCSERSAIQCREKIKVNTGKQKLTISQAEGEPYYALSSASLMHFRL